MQNTFLKISYILFFTVNFTALGYTSNVYADAGTIVNTTATNTKEEPQKAPQKPQLPLEELRTFADVFNQIRINYVEEIDDRTLLKNAIRGMLSGLDPHSNYLEGEALEELETDTRGEFGGLGLEVSMEDNLIKVISPIDDTPAARAGMQSGDLIVRLDDTPVKGLSLREAIELMRGPKDSEIKLTILREGEEQALEITLIRDYIKVTSVRSRSLEAGFLYIRIAQFQANTGADVLAAIDSLKSENPNIKGLVLDLRNNPGGVLHASIEVSDSFLSSGLIVYTEGRQPAMLARHTATPGDALEGAPMVVLINGGSASASEIVAGALQDHERAIIMGRRSFGKGSVQTVVPLSETQAIKLTTALYYTPNGRSIQAQGIEPDIIIERAKITPFKKRRRVTEADLKGHLDNGNNGEKSTSRDRDENKESLIKSDNQLFEALTLLKGYDLLKKINTIPTLN